MAAESASDIRDLALENFTDEQPIALPLSVPLVLDLDGTLFATDTLHEAFFIFLRRRWRDAWEIPLWVARGRAHVKEKLSSVVTTDDVAHFPVNTALEAFAAREAKLGREVVLATGADRSIAEKAQARFPFISRVVASDGSTNMTGAAKAAELKKIFPDGFVYAGDSGADIEVWRHCDGGVFAGARTGVYDRMRGASDVIAAFPRESLGLGSVRRAMRLHQWAKNALIFVPLVMGGKALSPHAWLHAFAAFLAFSLLASATYAINDLWDLHDDRRHWSKKARPVASGEMQISSSLWIIAICGLLAGGLALFAGEGCLGILALYLLLSLSYSLRLKREPIVDVLMLAGLFTIRLLLGVVVTDVVLSPWLLVFSMFVFLSLSLAKRHTEILKVSAHGRAVAHGRGYTAGDGPFVLALGASSMMAAVLVLTVYLIEDAFPKGFYTQPAFLWGCAVILFLWLSRIWLLSYRGQLHDDPVAFALKDRVSLLYGGLMVALFAAAII